MAAEWKSLENVINAFFIIKGKKIIFTCVHHKKGIFFLRAPSACMTRTPY